MFVVVGLVKPAQTFSRNSPNTRILSASCAAERTSRVIGLVSPERLVTSRSSPMASDRNANTSNTPEIIQCVADSVIMITDATVILSGCRRENKLRTQNCSSTPEACSGTHSGWIITDLQNFKAWSTQFEVKKESHDFYLHLLFSLMSVFQLVGVFVRHQENTQPLNNLL